MLISVEPNGCNRFTKAASLEKIQIKEIGGQNEITANSPIWAASWELCMVFFTFWGEGKKVDFFLRLLILWYSAMSVPAPTVTELPACELKWRDFLKRSDNFGDFFIFFPLRWIWGDVRKDDPAVTNLLLRWEHLQWILSKFNPADITPDQQNRKNNAQICHPLPHVPKVLFYWITPSSQSLKSMVWVPGTRCFTTQVLNNATSPAKPEGRQSGEKASLERSKADTIEDNDRQEAHKTERRKWDFWKLLITSSFLLRLMSYGKQWILQDSGAGHSSTKKKATLIL